MAEYEKLPRQKKTLNGRSHKTEISDDFECSAAFETILTLAGSAANVAPPPDFARKVMHRLSETGSGAPSLSDRLKMSFGYLTRPASLVEVATCYFLTGFFYLVLGICFHLGLKSLAVAPSAAGWLYYQPLIAVLTAMGFTTVGFLLLKKNRLAFRIANLATICYILFSIINGIQVQAIPASPLSSIGGLCFSAGSIMIGSFLAVTVNNFQRWPSTPTVASL
jgi:hypothetical protein